MAGRKGAIAFGLVYIPVELFTRRRMTPYGSTNLPKIP